MTTTTAPPLPGRYATGPVSARGVGLAGPTYGRVIGALFLAGFVTYGAGSALVTWVTGTDSLLPGVAAHQGALVLGAFLMLLNTAVDIGKAVLFFPVVERHSRRTALTYLSAMIFEVSLMAVGVLSLLLLVPLSEQADSGKIDGAMAASLGDLALDANEVAYQIGQAGLAFGAFFLCLLLYRARLVPRFLAGWGAVGYACHFAGATAELFGLHISLVLLIPGGLFEVALGIWLLARGLPTPATEAR